MDQEDDHRAPPVQFDPPPFLAPSAWFLGPNAENEATLTAMVRKAVEAHAGARRDYAPDDPDFIRPQDREADAVRLTRAAMEANLAKLTDALRGSIPLASYRNQSHMYWDISLPGAAGYFAAMLYNQNNVAAEASPVTTALEIEVGQTLCRMLGFDGEGDAKPWGHITCDGSVANGEALWMARNLRYQPAALAAALRSEPALAAARGVTVTDGPGRRVRLMDLGPWERMNLPVDAALGLPARIAEAGDFPLQEVMDALDRWSVQTLGLVEAHRVLLEGEGPATPALLVPATAHYSWPKGAALLGLGKGAVIDVPLDLDGRISVPALRARLDACLAERRPVLAVVAVMGTTGESAVDPLADILAVRDEYAQLGLGFAVHADAAWGGYFAAIQRKPGRNAPPDGESIAFDDDPSQAMSPYVARHFQALGQADSITVDPHKSGYMPYPAGALCYRDGRMRLAVAHAAPVVFHDGDVESVGVYGIEGSKPGAAPAGVALAHVTIPPDASGFGRLLGRCLFNAKRFYAAVATLAGPDDPFTIVPFNRLPAEKAGATPVEIEAQRRRIADDITGWSNAELVKALNADADLLSLFQSLGPDLCVMAYAFNFRIGGRLNGDLTLMNEMNQAMFRAMSIEAAHRGELPKARLFVTSTSLDASTYGERLTGDLCSRAGVTPVQGVPIRVLISTMMNPWVTQTAQGNFIPHLMQVLREEASAAAAEVIRRHGLT